jgi:ATP-dependent helicase/nuclease subunit A
LALWYAQTVARPLISGANGLLRWQLHDDSGLTINDAASSASVVESTPAGPTTAPNWEELRRKISWRYPFPADTHESAKASVSALRRRAVEADEDLARPIGPTTARWPEIANRASAKATAVEIGSALHAFMQFVNLEHTSSLGALETERERLIREGALTKEQGDLVDLRHAATFFASDIGEAILGQVGHVRRELAFTSRMALGTLADFLGGSGKTGTGWNPSLPALDDRGEKSAAVMKKGKKLGPGRNPSVPGVRSEQDFVVVQGAADLVVILPEEIWLLDFKTDRIKPQELPGRVAQYRPQVVLYASALASIYGRPVTRSWLYFLTLGRGISITARE